MGKEQVVLEQDANVPRLDRKLVDAPAMELDFAFKIKSRIQRAAHGGKQARFARAACAHHGVDASCRHQDIQPGNQDAPVQGQAVHAQRQAHDLSPARAGLPGWNRRGLPSQAARPNAATGSSHCSQA